MVSGSAVSITSSDPVIFKGSSVDSYFTDNGTFSPVLIAKQDASIVYPLEVKVTASTNTTSGSAGVTKILNIILK